MEKHNEVIVVGGNHYNTLWVARSLGIKDYKVNVIILDNVCKSFISHSRYVVNTYIVSSPDSLLDLLLTKRLAPNKTVLISASDSAAEFLDKYLDQLSSLYYLSNCQNIQGRLVYWMDKKNMIEAANKVGLICIPTITLNLEKFDDKQISELSYPILIKPEMSSHGSKSDFRICNDFVSLKKTLNELRNSCQHILLQKYIKPDFEINLMGVRYNEKCIIPGLVRKVKTCNSTHNMGMMTYSYLTNKLEDFIDKDIVEKFVKEIGYNGIFSMEFIIEKGIPYFLEINMRTDGTMYMHTDAGVNLPQIWADFNYQGESYGPFNYQKNRVYGMTEISYVKYLDWKRPIEAIKDWWRTDCYSIFSWTDVKPFIYKFVYELF